MDNQSNKLSKRFRTIAMTTALVASLLLLSCNGHDSGSIQTASDGATVMAFTPPEPILQSRMVDLDAVLLDVSVDVGNGATLIQLTRDQNGVWSGTTMVPSNSSVAVVVTWSESFSGRRLQLAEAVKEFAVAANAQDVSVRFLTDEFNISFDSDRDGRFNLDERNASSDPFDSASPGAAVISVPVGIQLDLPEVLLSASEEAIAALDVAAQVNGEDVLLTRTGNRWEGTTQAAENSSAFVVATFFESTERSVRLASIRRNQEVGSGTVLAVGADAYNSAFDDDNDGLLNFSEVQWRIQPIRFQQPTSRSV